MIRLYLFVCVALSLALIALIAHPTAPSHVTHAAAPAVAPYPYFNERVNVTVPPLPSLGPCCSTDGQRAGTIVRVYLPGNPDAPLVAVAAWRFDGTPEFYDKILPCELGLPPCWYLPTGP